MGEEKDIYFIPLFSSEMIRIKREICVKDTERNREKLVVEMQDRE